MRFAFFLLIFARFVWETPGNPFEQLQSFKWEIDETPKKRVLLHHCLNETWENLTHGETCFSSYFSSIQKPGSIQKSLFVPMIGLVYRP